MRFSAVILISVLADFSITCRKAEHFQTTGADNAPITKDNLPVKDNVKSSDSIPLLEISEDAEGMFSVTGKSLFFRLYTDGIAEFESQDEAKKEAGKMSYQAEKINTLRRVKLSSEETQKFKDLLISANFAKAKNEYQPKCCCVDMSLNYRIIINSEASKIIDLRNFCDLSGIKNPRAQDSILLPAKISELMTLIDMTRLKYGN